MFSVIYYTFCSTCFGCNTHPSSGATYNVHADYSHITVHLPVSSACTLYVAPEDGCVLYPKHVEQKV